MVSHLLLPSRHLLVVIAMVVGNNNIPIAEPSADVVGTYKECDIIRWTNNQLAEYKYFLYCEKNK